MSVFARLVQFGHSHREVLGYTPRLAMAYLAAHERQRRADLAAELVVANHATQGDRNAIRKLRSDLLK